MAGARVVWKLGASGVAALGSSIGVAVFLLLGAFVGKLSDDPLVSPGNGSLMTTVPLP